ncbi:MAG: hypothetical protein LBL65_05465 [Campylobacteraceae bacterium]|jgi:hypothetical protein|nr:hypothetical protein [Campylobacteraceae bacterium]
MNTQTTYLNQFVDAFRFLAKLDKAYRKTQPDFDEIKRVFMSNMIDLKSEYEVLRGKLRLLANSYLDHFDGPEVFANQCHSLSQEFLDIWQEVELARAFPLTVTIGNIFYKGENIFNISKSSLKRTLNEGMVIDKPLNAHVWLTLDDATVIDLSIISTLIRREKIIYSKEMPLALIWNESEPDDYLFEPLLVDNNFFWKIDKVDPALF